MANLINVKVVKRGFSGKNTYVARFDCQPSKDDLADAQIRAGFHPAGYGEPMNVALSPSKTMARWESWSCAD